jgi:hypothetical protein
VVAHAVDFLSRAFQKQGAGTGNLITPQKDERTNRFPDNYAPNMVFFAIVPGLRITEEKLCIDRERTLRDILQSVERRKPAVVASDKLRVSFEAVVLVLNRLIDEETEGAATHLMQMQSCASANDRANGF